MSIDLYLAFVAASTILLIIPGPTVLLVVSYVPGQGRGTAWATVPGVALGDLTARTVSLAGAGAVLAASATLFTALKLAGALYLVWLGIALWRSEPGRLSVPEAARKDRIAMFRTAYVVTALNPKGIVFFVAFVPQFVSPANPVLPQFAILTATFVTLAIINIAVWTVAAGEMRRRLSRPATLRTINRVGGGMLIGAGGLTALAGRTA